MCMSSSGTNTNTGTSIPVSEELRDQLRLEKARRGCSYETLLREEVTLE